MSILDTVTQGKRPRPRRTVVYGTHGIGKTTWASKWPKPLLLPTEDGFADIEIDTLPLITEARKVVEAAFDLSSENAIHPYKTVVLDSADWMEQLIWKDIISDVGKPDVQSIDDIGYGKGHTKTASMFRKVLQVFNQCRDAGLHVVIIAHCEIKRFEAPDGDAYDRYMPKLHRQSSAILQEWADEVLFAQYKTFTRKSDEGFGRERTVGVGTGERVLKTSEKPGHLAKNRLGLPDEMPFDFEEYAKYLPPLGNIDGAISGGSSKAAV